jgi:hypothetical protein
MAVGVFEGIEVVTALDIPLEYGQPLQLQGLLLTTVYLADVGLVGWAALTRPCVRLMCLVSRQVAHS